MGYLQRVHNFSFYTATWCENEWELKEKCGSGHLRGAAKSVMPEEDQVAALHEHRIERFLATAALNRPTLLTADSEPVAGHADVLFRRQTETHAAVAEAAFLADAGHLCAT